jgi:predicted transcriptional regulator
VIDEKLAVDIRNSLQNMERYLRILVSIQLKPALDEVLSDKKNKKIYELTGAKTASEIAKKTTVSEATISRLYAKWEILGLVTKDGVGYKKVL